MSAQTLIEALKQAGVREKVKVFVGGAPLTDGHASASDADRCATDARIPSEMPNWPMIEVEYHGQKIQRPDILVR